MRDTDRRNSSILARFFNVILAVILVASICMPVWAETESYDDNVESVNQVENINEETSFEQSEEEKNESDEEEKESTPETCIHNWGTWITTKPASYFDKGVRTRECANCQQKETISIDKKVAYNKWISYNGKKYYMDSKSNPVKYWNKLNLSNNKKGLKKWCYFNGKGVYIKNISGRTRKKWIKVGNSKFYFGSKGYPLNKGFHFIKGKLYYMNSSRAVTIGTFKDESGNSYTTNKKGHVSGLIYYIHKYKSFVLVDISEQKLYLYKNKKCLLETNVVTGNKGNHDTPTGSYKIGNKAMGVWLAGPTWGVRVKYWIPFIGGSYGFHDANWRSEGQFNSRTYKGNGSHGCVNMKTSAAATLYNKCYRGMTVIISN